MVSVQDVASWFGVVQDILKRAFEGKIVPQDPVDEPASMMLDKFIIEKTPRKRNREVCIG